MVEPVLKHQISAVLNSFAECWSFYVYEMSYFIPAKCYCTGEWFAKIWNGKKKVIRCSEVNHQQLPHVKGLRIEQILQFIKDQGSEAFLPPPTKNGKPIKYSRDWLIKVSHHHLVPHHLVIGRRHQAPGRVCRIQEAGPAEVQGASRGEARRDHRDSHRDSAAPQNDTAALR